MLFNSYVFLFAFLPLCYAVFSLIPPHRTGFKQWWLIVCSVFFYSWWHLPFLVVLISSILINYGLGLCLTKALKPRFLLLFGVLINLGILFWFKYSVFAGNLVFSATGSGFRLSEIALPIGISFFTFQQIAFLVDQSRSRKNLPLFRKYTLFVSFFPQLIAGPIVHHAEVVRQFDSRLGFSKKDFIVGASIFSVGLSKKVLLADQLALIANQGFQGAGSFECYSAWFFLSAYAVQLYFDFSGYSDMAIGLARMFGVKLPLNFHSPYKATSISGFWRRWHLTLTRFTTDYVYTPVALFLQRRSRSSASVKPALFGALVTFLVVGVWHGSGWNFILFGLSHGFAFIVNLLLGPRLSLFFPRVVWSVFSWSITMVFIMLSYVLFRAPDLRGAGAYFGDLFSLNGETGVIDGSDIAFVFGSWIIALLAPNTSEIFRRYRPAVDVYGWRSVQMHKGYLWKMDALGLSVTIFLFLCSFYWMGNVASEFIYFDF